LKLFVISLIITLPGHAKANTTLSNSMIHVFDSLLPEGNYTSLHAVTFLELLDAENNFKQAGNAKKTMVKLLRIAGMKNSFRNNTLGSRIFLDLANISIRLKMYPLAMKWYSQSTRLNRKKIIPSYNDSDTTHYSQIIQTDSFEIMHLSSTPPPESLPVRLQDIQCSFQDGKTAVSYAVIVHVKQPIHGRRKAFSGIDNVGHTFITLIKFNDDNSSVSRSFGFYPAKKHFLSATPLHPGDGPVFKDDALHPWDETVGKFITEKKFNRILDNLEKFSRTRYNLNRNNCTDFGLSEAIIAGINIKETVGRWPLGKGNNPANAGQSLLEGKFENKDKEYPETLIVNEGQILFDAN
jgi:hypothetical protein